MPEQFDVLLDFRNDVPRLKSRGEEFDKMEKLLQKFQTKLKLKHLILAIIT